MVKYKKIGNTYHLYIKSALNIQDILKIHPSLWIAMSAPISAFNIDLTFLQYIDETEGNGRLIFQEVQRAVKWLIEVLKDHEGINSGADCLVLDSINRDNSDGELIFVETKKILDRIDGHNQDRITLEQIRGVKSEVEKYPVSENGVATVDAASTDELKKYIQDIINVTGGEDHLSGIKGVGLACLDIFNQKLQDYIKWREYYSDALNSDNRELLPWGEKTNAVFKQFIKIKDKIDQYFIQCSTLNFSKQVSDNVSFLSDTEFNKMNWHEIAELEQFLVNAPLAKPSDNAVLDLTNVDMINPLFIREVKQFFAEVSAALKKNGIEKIDAELWADIKNLFNCYKSWYDSNPESAMDNIDYIQLVSYRDNLLYESLLKIIETCKITALQMSNIRLIEKLILYQKNMLVFVNNFVSMPYLYDKNTPALFEKGNLIIDGRQMNFSVLVEDKASHMKVAKEGNIFILYLQIMPAADNKYIVVVPVTNGGKGNLAIGKRGVFIDNDGVALDAVVVDIIENPISIREALLLPFKKIKEAFSSRLSGLSKETDVAFTKNITDVSMGKSITETKPAAGKTSGFNPTSLLMGGSVAIAALGSSFAYIMSKLSSISFMNFLFVAVGIIAVFLFFSLLSTYLKLKRRDLSPILEGSGWSINAKLRLTRKLAKIYTQKPKWPKGSKRKLI